MRTTTAADPGWVYGLIDPRDQLVRYVGSTRVSPLRRFQQHLNHRAIYAHRVSKKDIWIKDLVTLGLAPTLQVLEETTGDNLAKREQWWRKHIAQQQGMPHAAGWIGDCNPWIMAQAERPSRRRCDR